MSKLHTVVGSKQNDKKEKVITFIKEGIQTNKRIGVFSKAIKAEEFKDIFENHEERESFKCQFTVYECQSFEKPYVDALLTKATTLDVVILDSQQTQDQQHLEYLINHLLKQGKEVLFSFNSIFPIKEDKYFTEANTDTLWGYLHKKGTVHLLDADRNVEEPYYAHAK